MYRHCIYCSADLGTNDAVEAFPVGRTLAFDAAKGRLWAVCGRCARWNLSPVEDRWEPVEAAERLFRDARLRVQSENVGLARLPDGTRLIRVGAALPGELAAWRYGGELVKRRRQYIVSGVGAAVVGLTLAAGVAYAAAGVGAMIALQIGSNGYGAARRWRQGNRPLHTLDAAETPHGWPLVLRRRDLADAALHARGETEIELHVKRPREIRRQHARLLDPPIVLCDRTARRVLERGLLHVNEAGASEEELAWALGRISGAGSAEQYIHGTARASLVLEGPNERKRRMAPGTALALEMALHEEQERRAMEGELSILEAAWRDAEPVAEIADRLALEPTE